MKIFIDQESYLWLHQYKILKAIPANRTTGTGEIEINKPISN